MTTNDPRIQLTFGATRPAGSSLCSGMNTYYWFVWLNGKPTHVAFDNPTDAFQWAKHQFQYE